MGCGQSKIHLYPKKSKSKVNGVKGGHTDSDADADEDDGNCERTQKEVFREKEKQSDDLEQDNKVADTDCDLSVSVFRAKNFTLLQNQEISTSQQNFFQMLDKKIEEGPDYDAASETEIALEEARLNALVQHWESASLTASLCSSASRSVQSTPVHQISSTPSQSILQSNIPQHSMKLEYLPHKAPLKYEYPADHPQTEHQHLMQLSSSQMMQQMPSVPQQIPVTMLPQNAIPMNSAAILSSSVSQARSQSQQEKDSRILNLSSNSPQPPLMLANASTSPRHIVDSRVVMVPHSQAFQYKIPSQTQTQQQYAMVTSSNEFPNDERSASSSTNIIPNNSPYMPMQMVYYKQPAQQVTAQQPIQQGACFGDVTNDLQIQLPPPDYRFPPVISVQRLAPQVQKQLRETQELIKDSCPQLYAAGYGGSPGPPVRSQMRNSSRRPTLETQFSQELS